MVERQAPVGASEAISLPVPEFQIPTTGVLVGDDLYYIANAQPHYSSRRASIGWMRRPCRTGPTAAITPSVNMSKTTSGSSIAR